MLTWMHCEYYAYRHFVWIAACKATSVKYGLGDFILFHAALLRGAYSSSVSNQTARSPQLIAGQIIL